MSSQPVVARLRAAVAPADALIAAGAAVIQVVGTVLAARHQPNADSLDALGYGLLVGGPVMLLGRRRWPVLVLAGVFAATFGYDWLDYPGGPIWASLIVAFFTVVAAGKRVAAYTSLAAGYLSGVWLDPMIRDKPGPGIVQALGFAAWLLALAAVSEIVRYRGQLREAASREAAEVRRGELEAARRRASEERLDIARELHDVLAHGISMINVQAGVALELMDDQPDRARMALTTIKQASKNALVEVQAVLGALRQAGEAAATAPAPGLADLDRLVSAAQAAGLRVDVQVEGEAQPLPVGTDLAAYRILQESLTNVVRHARARVVTVRLGYGADGLTVQIDDDGRPGPPNGATAAGGNGIAGMRERATALGGEFAAGRSLAGGFRVQVRLPVAPGEGGA